MPPASDAADDSDASADESERSIFTLGSGVFWAPGMVLDATAFNISSELAATALQGLHLAGTAAGAVAHIAEMHKIFAADMGSLGVDYLAGSPLTLTVSAFLEAQERTAQEFAALVAGLPDLALERALALPSNLADYGNYSDAADLIQLSMAEGLQFGWVPSPPVIQRLVDAPSRAARREVLRRHAAGIVSDCIRVLDSIEDPALNEYAVFAREGVDALRLGKRAAAQALCASLLDTLLYIPFGENKRRITDQRSAPIPERLAISAAVVLPGVWGAHRNYWPERGEEIPRDFSRHASAHGVSRRQFTHGNAVLAVMHVVALLKLLDEWPNLTINDVGDAFPETRKKPRI